MSPFSEPWNRVAFCGTGAITRKHHPSFNEIPVYAKGNTVYEYFLYGEPLFKKVRKIFKGQGHQSQRLQKLRDGRIAQPVGIFDLGKIYPNR